VLENVTFKCNASYSITTKTLRGHAFLRLYFHYKTQENQIEKKTYF